MNRPVESIVDTDTLDKQILKKIERLGNQIHNTRFTPEEDRIIIACRKKYIGYVTISKEFMPSHSSTSIKYRYQNYLK